MPADVEPADQRDPLAWLFWLIGKTIAVDELAPRAHPRGSSTIDRAARSGGPAYGRPIGNIVWFLKTIFDDIEPYLLDPLAWSACYVAMDDTYTIRTYTYWRQSGGTWTIKLNCGYSQYGYKHIEINHETQWRDRIIQAAGGGLGNGWDDLMSWAAEETIAWPFVSTHRPSNNTRCVGAPIIMYDGDGDYVYTFYPSFVFSQDNKYLITAIPGSSYTC